MTHWKDRSGIVESARVQEVLKDRVVLYDQRGGRVEAFFQFGVPNESPRVGEYWYITSTGGVGNWKLESRISLKGHNSIKSSIVVDAGDCVGRESSVVEEIVSWGVDEVWLVIASNGRYYWDSEVAEDYGLSFGGDVASAVIRRVRKAGRHVVLCIDWGLWGDVSDTTHNRYQQERYLSGTLPDSVREYLPFASPAKAREALGGMIAEFSERFRDKHSGVAVLNVHLHGSDSDYSPGTALKFFNGHGEWPDSTNDDWQEFREETVSDCMSYLKGKVYDGSLVVTVPPSVWRSVDEMCGRVDNGIGDSFVRDSSVGGFGFNLDPAHLDFDIALLKRLALGASPIAGVSASSLGSLGRILTLLHKYEVKRVVVGSFAELEQMGSGDKFDFRKTIQLNSLKELSDSVSVGVICSSNSRDVYWETLGEAAEYAEVVSEVLGGVAEGIGYRLAVILDEDLSLLGDSSFQRERLGDIRTVVAIGVVNMSDDSVMGLIDLLSRQDKNVVASGLVGYNEARTSEVRTPPLWKLVGGRFVSVSSQNEELVVGSNSPVYANSVWETRTWESQSVAGVDSVIEGGLVLVFDGRSVLSGIDLHQGSTSRFLLESLIIYSASR